MAFDVVILNGTIVDGSGAPRYKADVGVSSGRIEAIGALGNAEAARRIDAAGHVVVPGFIDIHSHSDVTLFDDPGGESKAYQGVTTEVTGNCSYTPFPAGKGGPPALQDNLGKTLIGDTRWEWDTLDDWAGALESNGISINVAPQVGNSALQIASGAIEDRPATPDEMREMKRLVAEAVEMGAFSLSTGLSVTPSAYARTDEIVALCEAIRPYEGAFYATHARVGDGKHISAIEEAIEIGQRAGVPVQFSHLAITDWRVYGDGPKMVDMFVEAREGGLDITYDMYPYTAAGAGFNQLIPLWVQAGTIEDFIARLKDPRDEGARTRGGRRRARRPGAQVGDLVRGIHPIGGQPQPDRQERRGDRRGAGHRARRGGPPGHGRGERLGAHPRPQPRRERRPLLHGPRPGDDRLRRQGRLAGRAVQERAPTPQVLRHLPAHPGPLRPRAARRADP